MPLSEHEQKILAELEESLSKQDPRFAKNVRDTNVYSHGTRRVRWASWASWRAASSFWPSSHRTLSRACSGSR